jgi:polar amino acid transport system substrate-binding protein
VPSPTAAASAAESGAPATEPASSSAAPTTAAESNPPASGAPASGAPESGAPASPSTAPASSAPGSNAPSSAPASPSSAPASAEPPSSPAGGSPVAAASISPECQAANLKTKTAGKLTVNTDNPAFSPWFEGTVPQGSDWADFGGYPPSGQGFESAIAYGIATELGFTDDQVTWTANTNFNDAFKPGPKDYDFHLAQDSYKPKRADTVDFSKSYYDVAQAVVATSASPIASATTVADLAQYKLGVAEGTTSLDSIEQLIKPTTDAKVYADNDHAVKALKNGQVDALVVDLPTAFEIAAAELANGTVVGQLPPLGGKQEYFGVVLQKDSPMTGCVNQAIDAMKADGTWQSIFDQWLSGPNAAPILQ